MTALSEGVGVGHATVRVRRRRVGRDVTTSCVGVSSVSIVHLPALATLGFSNVALDPGGCIAWVVAAGIAGWLAGLGVRGHSFGCLAQIALGLVGARIGLFILSLLPGTFA